jgi:hypothetical protein
MSGTLGEVNIRIEHKLDAILVYLKRLTGESPITLEKPIHGLNGLTNGKCPITDTNIHLRLDPKTGLVSREDGLSSGIVEGQLPAMPDNSMKFKGIMSKDLFGGDDGSEA